ncbi:uncharacterized protein LOC8027206 [Ixodes scapularis]|uniref:uncharacterized protein LOC8027206 n=1 Tax=Ixodes scapularis TaxID=6945 RepID=UPI001A9F7833|nr:uncharacterized protein LOC8027206 [Ixodes scapularis]
MDCDVTNVNNEVVIPFDTSVGQELSDCEAPRVPLRTLLNSAGGPSSRGWTAVPPSRVTVKRPSGLLPPARTFSRVRIPQKSFIVGPFRSPFVLMSGPRNCLGPPSEPQTTGKSTAQHTNGPPILVKLPVTKPVAEEKNVRPTGPPETSVVGELRAKWDAATKTLIFPAAMPSSAVGALCQKQNSNVVFVDRLRQSVQGTTSAKVTVVGGGKISSQGSLQPSQSRKAIIVQPDGKRVEAVRVDGDPRPANQCPASSTVHKSSLPRIITVQPPQNARKVEVVITPPHPKKTLPFSAHYSVVSSTPSTTSSASKILKVVPSSLTPATSSVLFSCPVPRAIEVCSSESSKPLQSLAPKLPPLGFGLPKVCTAQSSGPDSAKAATVVVRNVRSIQLVTDDPKAGDEPVKVSVQPVSTSSGKAGSVAGLDGAAPPKQEDSSSPCFRDEKITSDRKNENPIDKAAQPKPETALSSHTSGAKIKTDRKSPDPIGKAAHSKTEITSPAFTSDVRVKGERGNLDPIGKATQSGPEVSSSIRTSDIQMKSEQKKPDFICKPALPKPEAASSIHTSAVQTKRDGKKPDSICKPAQPKPEPTGSAHASDVMISRRKNSDPIGPALQPRPETASSAHTSDIKMKNEQRNPASFGKTAQPKPKAASLLPTSDSKIKSDIEKPSAVHRNQGNSGADIEMEDCFITSVIGLRCPPGKNTEHNEQEKFMMPVISNVMSLADIQNWDNIEEEEADIEVPAEEQKVSESSKTEASWCQQFVSELYSKDQPKPWNLDSTSQQPPDKKQQRACKTVKELLSDASQQLSDKTQHRACKTTKELLSDASQQLSDKKQQRAGRTVKELLSDASLLAANMTVFPSQSTEKQDVVIAKPKAVSIEIVTEQPQPMKRETVAPLKSEASSGSTNVTSKLEGSKDDVCEKLQQAIAQIEEVTLRSRSAFDEAQRSMLESMFNKIKKDTCLLMSSKGSEAEKSVPGGSPTKNTVTKEPVLDEVSSKVTPAKDSVADSLAVKVPPTKQSLGNMPNFSPPESMKKPLRRIVITSDSSASLNSNAIKDGIEKFLQANKIPNYFSQDELLSLHWDGKDIRTFHFKNGPDGQPANSSGVAPPAAATPVPQSMLSTQPLTTSRCVIVNSETDKVTAPRMDISKVKPTKYIQPKPGGPTVSSVSSICVKTQHQLLGIPSDPQVATTLSSQQAAAVPHEHQVLSAPGQHQAATAPIKPQVVGPPVMHLGFNQGSAVPQLPQNNNAGIPTNAPVAQAHLYGYPIKVVKSNGEVVSIDPPAGWASRLQMTGALPPEGMQFGFRPRIIKIVKNNGDVLQQMFLDNRTLLPITTSTAAPCSQTPARLSSAPLSNANPPAFMQIVPISLSRAVAPHSSTSGSTLPLMPPESLQRLVSSAIQESGSKTLQSSKQIMVQYVAKKPEATTSEAKPGGAPAPPIPEAPETKPEATSSAMLDFSETDTCDGDEFRALLEPEVVLEEANMLLSVRGAEEDSGSDSSSSDNFVPSSPGSDDSNCATYKRPATKRQKRAMAAAAKRKRAKAAAPKPPRKRGAKRKAAEGEERGLVPARKRRRRSKKASRQRQKPANKGARRTTPHIPVNCANLSDVPCMVVMHHIRDSLLHNGRVDLAKCDEEQLFVEAESSAVTLCQGTVIDVLGCATAVEEVALSPSPDMAPKKEKEELARLLKDRKKDLEELRMRYK